MCVVVAGWRYTLAVTWVRAKEPPTTVLERLWAEVSASKIACKRVLLDRYFFTVPVLTWLQAQKLPFVVPVVMRGRKPKRGTKPKGLRACRGWKAGAHDYTHRAGTESVTFRLVISYKSYRHPRTKKRGTKKLFFATWKVRLDPTAVRDTYRTRFGIEASYRQLNQSRARTSTRDPLYRLLLVGLSLFLRNVWQWLVRSASPDPRRPAGSDPQTPSPPTTRYQDLLDALCDYPRDVSQRPPSSPLTA